MRRDSVVSLDMRSEGVIDAAVVVGAVAIRGLRVRGGTRQDRSPPRSLRARILAQPTVVDDICQQTAQAADLAIAAFDIDEAGAAIKICLSADGSPSPRMHAPSLSLRSREWPFIAADFLTARRTNARVTRFSSSVVLVALRAAPSTSEIGIVRDSVERPLRQAMAVISDRCGGHATINVWSSVASTPSSAVLLV